jgi:D-beta-D-heptose 7-phosphate kinase/D-beta-D-heptose 1-phosphate adenosyltransferase
MKTVFTNGCFDILHRGHIELLKFCKECFADTRLVVGLNSDQSIKRLKGADRPFNNEADRYFMLKSIKFVDDVIIFDEDTPYEIIKKIKPDALVKGGDYTKESVIGKELVKDVIIFNYIPGYSTTKILNYGNNL